MNNHLTESQEQEKNCDLTELDECVKSGKLIHLNCSKEFLNNQESVNMLVKMIGIAYNYKDPVKV